jgi:CxxC-x17-CxxC domain-containing protein
MEDKTLVCEDCGKEFVFSVSEQEFYAEKGLLNIPKRCPDCRKARRHKSKRRFYDAKCSACGIDTKVPFKPVEGRDVYCKDCFAKMKEQSEQNEA